MSSQATVHSIDELKDFRVALALYGEDTLGALGAVEAEVRRTVRWLEEERPVFWHEQIKRRREQVSLARGEVFRRNLQKRPDYTPPMSEQKEALRKAEASLQDAEKRLALVRKWQPRIETRGARVSRERAAPQGPGGRRRSQRGQPAHPDHRRARGLSPSGTPVGSGPGRRRLRPSPERRPRPSSSRSRPRSSTRCGRPTASAGATEGRGSPRRTPMPRPRSPAVRPLKTRFAGYAPAAVDPPPD